MQVCFCKVEYVPLGKDAKIERLAGTLVDLLHHILDLFQDIMVVHIFVPQDKDVFSQVIPFLTLQVVQVPSFCKGAKQWMETAFGYGKRT
ncbi:hypothetical protein SDC9_112843 [bioreactor metagenome]|uniref:Uncharacterized protein n=1 Tax=bioreactor metagenome TaxID=1076179 RepID=A0A645BKC6_9ZZZZ